MQKQPSCSWLQLSTYFLNVTENKKDTNTHLIRIWEEVAWIRVELGSQWKCSRKSSLTGRRQIDRPTQLLSLKQTFRTFRPDNCAATEKGKVFSNAHCYCCHHSCFRCCPAVNEGLRTFLWERFAQPDSCETDIVGTFAPRSPFFVADFPLLCPFNPLGPTQLRN